MESNREEPILLEISPDSFTTAFPRHKGFFVSLFNLLFVSNGFMSIFEFFTTERSIESFVVFKITDLIDLFRCGTSMGCYTIKVLIIIEQYGGINIIKFILEHVEKI